MANKTRGQGSERVMKKLKTSVELGQYYEAHQMYRTLYFRYLAQNRYDELITLLFDGAVLFLTHNQLNSGADLAVLLVDVLSESEKAVTDDHMDKLGHLFSLMSADSPERMSYLAAALRWSSKSTDGKNSTGHPRLHQSIALTLWKEKNYPQSRYHFIHSTDGHGCASMLVEYHITKGYPSEVDLFIAQTVFQFLCLKNRSTACTAFHSYTEKHPSVKGPPFLLPLLNFLQFLLLAVDRGEYSMDKKFFKGLGELRTILWGEREKLAFFKLLCEQYQPSLNRDPTYAEYVDRIGQLFFGLSPPPKQQGMLGNIIQSLLGSFDDDTFSNEETEPVAGSSKETVYRIQDEELD